MDIESAKTGVWIIGIIFSAGVTWGIARFSVKSNTNRLDTQGRQLDDHGVRIGALEANRLEQLTHKQAEAKFVTRKEFDLHMENVKLEIRHVSKDTAAIKEQNNLILAAVTGQRAGAKHE